MTKKKNHLRHAGVVGYPITQSLSPVIHNEWARREGRNASYHAIEIAPEDFNVKIRQLALEGYAGVNVTMPHKINALAISDIASKNALIAGAANMLTFDGTKIIADNSDIVGFQKAFEAELKPDDDFTIALVLGAGGAASGVIIALIQSGFKKIYISNRTPEKANDLVKKLRSHYTETDFQVILWKNYNQQNADVIVNTTALGMAGNPALDFVIDPKKGHRVVADIVYSPLVTPLLFEAREYGLRTIDGLSMLMYQAVPGYKTWLGEEATVDTPLRNLLEQKIAIKTHKKTIVIGLTGSIGMGKSTVAKMFAEEDCAVWDADAAVHRLYDVGGAAVEAVGEEFPDAVLNDVVDRGKLSAILQKNPDRLKTLEAIVHPLVALDRIDFLKSTEQQGVDICVLDIPLLFENGTKDAFDAVVVVSAAADIQKKRVLARSNMSLEKLETILARQMPDIQKREQADYIIPTDVALEKTRAEVARVLTEIRQRY